MFTATSISHTDRNEPFVATMESPNYPFFGVAFHPEKAYTIYHDGDPDTNPNHTWGSVLSNRYFSDLFISQVRVNNYVYGDFATV